LDKDELISIAILLPCVSAPLCDDRSQKPPNTLVDQLTGNSEVQTMNSVYVVGAITAVSCILGCSG